MKQGSTSSQRIVPSKVITKKSKQVFEFRRASPELESPASIRNPLFDEMFKNSNEHPEFDFTDSTVIVPQEQTKVVPPRRKSSASP